MTPLQLTAIFNSFASLGHYYKPRLFKSVSLQNNQLVLDTSNTYSYTLDEHTCYYFKLYAYIPFLIKI